MIETVLGYIKNEAGEVLLQYKARGFGQGKYNAAGGKLEPGERPADAMRREYREETGIELLGIEKRAELEFVFEGRPEWDNFCHVFVADAWRGEPRPSREGELRWFSPARLPFDEMWEDDKIWLEAVLNGARKKYRFLFNSDGRLVGHKELA